MIYIGEKTFQGGYVGEKKISKIYIDNTVAYESGMTPGLYEIGHAGEEEYLIMSWSEIKSTYPDAFEDDGKTIASNDKYQSYFRSLSGDFVIGSEIMNIDGYAFENCIGLTGVTIGSGVGYIGYNAFFHCTGLETIIVNENNKYYRSENNCVIEKASNKLIFGCKNSTIPNSVTSIRYAAFYDCTGLTNITIPDSVTDIGEEAFMSCEGLTSVTIENGVINIGDGVFYDCTGLTSITIPDSVTSIGKRTFYDCTGLTDVTMGNGITSISEKTFDGCSGLTHISLPNSLTAIEGYAFKGCSSLSDIYYTGTRTQWNVIAKDPTWDYDTGDYTIHYLLTPGLYESGHAGDSKYLKMSWEEIKNTYPAAFRDGEKTIIGSMGYVFVSYFKSLSGDFVISDEITKLASAAFRDCTELTSIEIPDGVTNIKYSAF